MPPIDPHIASYALLNFYEKYLYEGTQTLVLGDLNDKTVSNMTQDDYNKRVSEIKQNLKSCQVSCCWFLHLSKNVHLSEHASY